MKNSTFARLARTITVGDICSPFICAADADETIDSLDTHYAQGTLIDPADRWDDGTGTLLVVCQDEKACGWYDLNTYNYGESHSTTTVYQVAKNFKWPVIRPDVPLLEAIERMAEDSGNGLLVANDILIGILQPSDLYKMEVRLCLFSLILAIEERITNLIQFNPTYFAPICHDLFPRGKFSFGKPIHRNVAQDESKFDDHSYDETYYPNYPYEEREEEIETFYLIWNGQDAKKVSELYFTTKLNILTKGLDIKATIPDWIYPYDKDNPSNVHTLVELRNKIAHQHADSEVQSILSISAMPSFIRWMQNVYDAIPLYLGPRYFMNPEQARKRALHISSIDEDILF